MGLQNVPAFFADEYVRRTVGVPTTTQVPDMEPALKVVQNILPKLEARIIEFLSEWLVTFLMPTKHVLDTRAPHLYFMSLKEYWFRELYLGLKVTASFDRSESYTRIIDWTGQMHHTRLQAQRPAGSMERPVHHRVCPRMDDSSHIPQPAQGKH